MSDTTVIDVTGESQDKPTRASASRGGLGGGLWLLTRRRLWRDRWLVVSSAVIVAIATLIAFAAPLMVATTIDAGAQDAMSAAGPSAALTVSVPVGNPTGDNVNSVPGLDPSEYPELQAEAVSNLPATLGELVEDSTAWALSPQIPLDLVASGQEVADAVAEERPFDAEERVGDYLQFGLTEGADVELVAGELPADATGEATDVSGPYAAVGVTESTGLNGEPTYRAPEVLEFAATPAVADTLELELGDVMTVLDPSGIAVALTLTGLVQPADPDAAAWELFPESVEPLVADNPTQALFRRGTVLLSPATLTALTQQLGSPVPGTIRVEFSPDGLTLDSARTVARELRELGSDPGSLLPDSRVVIKASSGLGPALEAYPARARAAMAQMSVTVAGVIAVAGVVIALMSRLLISRREKDIALERARGASVPSIGLRLAMESVLVAAAGFVAGWAVANAWVGEVSLENEPALMVALVALLASPVLGVLMARRTWTGRREPANRQDRAKLRRAKATRRVTLEVLAVALGVLSVVTLRSRGVLQTQTDGIDVFLASAPVLVALAMVVIVLRLYPLPMLVVQAIARRTRGVAGVIALAKAREKVSMLPLLALTMAISVAVAGGLLVGTVRDGQDQASWERVGGEVRIDAEVDDVTAEALTQEGLTVSRDYVREFTTLWLGNEYLETTLVAQDLTYPDIVSASGLTDAAELRELNDLAQARADDEPVPVLASQELVDLDYGAGASSLYLGREYVDVEIVGVATVTPDGWQTGPFVIAPFGELLEFEYDTPFASNVAFVDGPGAADAVAGQSSIAASSVTTRAGWLDGVRDSALIGGVEFLMAIAVATVGALAAVALLVTVMQGVRERGRALSMLRTQGMSSRYGWWLAWTELGPLTLAALVGGAGAGLAILLLLGESLGLEVLSGGLTTPPLVVDPVFLGAVLAGTFVLLLIAVAMEVAAHRRDKLSDVLRYGESR